MTGDRLRQAAQKIRETAQDATSAVGLGKWVAVLTGNGYGVDASIYNALDGASEEVANHAALWSPPVALAVADWLEEVAEHWDTDEAPEFAPEDVHCPNCSAGQVADLILDGAS
jgi:hypothetical protein